MEAAMETKLEAVQRETLVVLRELRGMLQNFADVIGMFSPEDIARWRELMRTRGAQSSDDGRRMRMWQAHEAVASGRLPDLPPAKKAKAETKKRARQPEAAGKSESGPAKKAKAAKVPRDYATEKEARQCRMACEESQLYSVLAERWGELHARVVAVRACGGKGDFDLLVGALQLELDNKMQTGRFMAVVEGFIAQKERGRTAESDSAVGSDTEVDSDGPYS
jgi:hypothetical protein